MAKKSDKKEEKLFKKELITRHSFFYAICIFALLQFLLIPLQSRSYYIFWLIGLGGYFIILFELFYKRFINKSLPDKYRFIKKRVLQKTFFLHLVLPSLLYISGVIFLFFNRVKLLDQVGIVILTFSFWLLSYNISMTYSKVYSVSYKTKYIFDFIRIIIFYFLTDASINIVLYHGIPRYLIYLAVVILATFLITLSIVIFDQFGPKLLLYNALISLTVGVLLWLVMSLVIFNIAVLSLVVTVYFYLVLVFWHHKLEGTFSWDVMTQYMLFALMAIILLLYL